tara:strand:- start:167 stop:1693 length:1527 start_codon:yes stop_codon:yes gene_type:complete
MDAMKQSTSGKRTISPEVAKMCKDFVGGNTQPLLDRLEVELEKQSQNMSQFIHDLKAWENKNDQLIDKAKELNDEKINELFTKVGFGEDLQEQSTELQGITSNLVMKYLDVIGKRVKVVWGGSTMAGRNDFIPMKGSMKRSKQEEFFDDIYINQKILSPGITYIIQNENIGNIDNIGRKTDAMQRAMASLNFQLEDNPYEDTQSNLLQLFSANKGDKNKFLEALKKDEVRNEEFLALVESQQFSLDGKVRKILMDEHFDEDDWEILQDSDVSHLAEGEFDDDKRHDLVEMLEPIQEALGNMEDMRNLDKISHGTSSKDRFTINPESSTYQEDKEALSQIFSRSLGSALEQMAQDTKSFFDSSGKSGARAFEGEEGEPEKVKSKHWFRARRHIKKDNPTSLSYGKIVMALAALEDIYMSSKEIKDAAKEYFAYLQYVLDEGEDSAKNEAEVNERKEKLDNLVKSKYSSIRQTFFDMLEVKMNKILANPKKYPTKGSFNMHTWLKKQVKA